MTDANKQQISRQNVPERIARRKRRRLKKRVGIKNVQRDANAPHKYVDRPRSLGQKIAARAAPILSLVIISAAMIYFILQGYVQL